MLPAKKLTAANKAKKKTRTRSRLNGALRPTTTIKVSRRVMRHIETSSKHDESIDETLKRLLNLVIEDVNKVVVPPPLTTTIKVSRMVMSYIQKEAKKEESRDYTISRLLGIDQDDGNVQVKVD